MSCLGRYDCCCCRRLRILFMIFSRNAFCILSCLRRHETSPSLHVKKIVKQHLSQVVLIEKSGPASANHIPAQAEIPVTKEVIEKPAKTSASTPATISTTSVGTTLCLYSFDIEAIFNASEAEGRKAAQASTERLVKFDPNEWPASLTQKEPQRRAIPKMRHHLLRHP